MTEASEQGEGKKHRCRELPKYIHKRGGMLWVRVKDATGRWQNSPTGCTVGQLDQAIQFLRAKQKAVASLVRTEQHVKVLTFQMYAQKWAMERITRGIATGKSDKSRLEKYVYPEFGHVAIEELRPFHVRDLIEKLKARSGDDAMAPRSILHVYHIVHSIYESAIVDEVVTWNPVKVKRGVLPKKIDLDPEWRGQATYQTAEVEKILNAAIIPPERRVMYALKALAGLRHGEAAAMCWRHLDEMYKPLAKLSVAQAFQATTGEIKRTKDETTREVPVHPTLLRILQAWRDSHWVRVYGRKPTKDDFIVPTRSFRPVHPSDANEALKVDLVALELRVEAGSLRDRGGHDLRGWYQTQAIEDGADSLLIRRTTHAAPKNVEGGYERFSWKSRCAATAKLAVELAGDDPLAFVTESSQARSAATRFRKSVTPLGLEGIQDRKPEQARAPDTDGTTRSVQRMRKTAWVRPVTSLVTVGKMLEDALQSNDLARIKVLSEQLLADKADRSGRR